MAAPTPTRKHYVHLRSFRFECTSVDNGCNLVTSPGDVVVFVYDAHSGSAAQHVVCVPAASCSPVLRPGGRWELEVPVGAEDELDVYDPQFSFMRCSIVVQRGTTDRPLSAHEDPSGGAVVERFADSFVYAAANNQISIVRRRLGLAENDDAAAGALPHSQGAASSLTMPSASVPPALQSHRMVSSGLQYPRSRCLSIL